MTIYVVKIIKPGNGNPAYWYADKIGQCFECIKSSTDSIGQNGFCNPCFQLKPPADFKTGGVWENREIRIEDAVVIDTYHQS